MGFGQPRGSRDPRQQVTGRVFPTTPAPSQSASPGGPTVRPGITAPPIPAGVEMRKALMELFGVGNGPAVNRFYPMGGNRAELNPDVARLNVPMGGNGPAENPFVARLNAPMGGNGLAVNPIAALSNGLMGGGGLLAQGLLSAIFRRMMGGW